MEPARQCAEHARRATVRERQPTLDFREFSNRVCGETAKFRTGGRCKGQGNVEHILLSVPYDVLEAACPESVYSLLFGGRQGVTMKRYPAQGN